MQKDKIFSKKKTGSQLKELYDYGLTQTEQYWDFGYPLLSKSFPTLRSGLMFIVAPENLGKTQFQINLAYGAMSSSESVYWLDISLDDSVEDRLSYLLARAGDIPINLSKKAGAADTDTLQSRLSSFELLHFKFGDRYRLLGTSGLRDDLDTEVPHSAEGISELVAEARAEIGQEAKLLVAIDGFHDVDLASRYEDENGKSAQKSLILKRAALESDALLILTAHSRKDSRRRGMTADVLKGEGRIIYDAKVVIHLYSDVNLNRENASIFWVDASDPTKKQPVHEVDIIKNKAGGFKDVLYYNFVPARCQDFEVDEQQQDLYRSYVFAKESKDKS